MNMSKVNELLDGCWIDVFEKPWFDGKMKRLHGPGRFGPLDEVGSIIVGPAARVMNVDVPMSQAFKPKQLVPEMTMPKTGGKVKGFVLVAAEKR